MVAKKKAVKKNVNKTVKKAAKKKVLTRKKTDKNICMFFSLTGTNDRIADLISLEMDAVKVRVSTAGWGKMKVPFHMLLGVLERDVIRIPDHNIRQYKNVFFGGPVWGGKPCPALVDMIKKTEVKGKEVYVFLTADKDFGKSEKIVRDLVKHKNGNIKSVMKFMTHDSEDKIISEFRRLDV